MDVADGGRRRVESSYICICIYICMYSVHGGGGGVAAAAIRGGGAVGGSGGGGNRPSCRRAAFRVCNLHTECPAASDTRLGEAIVGGQWRRRRRRCVRAGGVVALGTEGGGSGGPRPNLYGHGGAERRGLCSA